MAWMSDKTARYLKIPGIELQDLVEDIDLRIQTQQARKDHCELEADIEKKFTSFLEEYEFPHAIESFVTRKMRKVPQFCQYD